jgi:hypothetical protein
MATGATAPLDTGNMGMPAPSNYPFFSYFMRPVICTESNGKPRQADTLCGLAFEYFLVKTQELLTDGLSVKLGQKST